MRRLWHWLFGDPRPLWQRSVVSGRVINLNTEPVMGARVRISAGSRFVAEVLTDANGDWSLAKDPAGSTRTRYDVLIVDEHNCVLAMRTMSP